MCLAIEAWAQARRCNARSTGMSRKRADGVEGVLRKADAALDDWFRQSRITTHQASVAFGRFLERPNRQSAGVLRDRVEGLKAGLGELSSGAVMHRAEVWLDGTRIGEHEGGFTPFVFDVTKLARPGSEYDLVVRVVNPLNALREYPALPTDPVLSAGMGGTPMSEVPHG